MAFSSPHFYIKVSNTIHVNNLSIYQTVHDEIRKNGCDCSLNYIDVSYVSSLSGLFSGCAFPDNKFPDISGWNISNVKYMRNIFYRSSINCDLSMWDTSNVEDMSYAFAFAIVKNTRISNWNMDKVRSVEGMFIGSYFNEDISAWNLASVKNKKQMFAGVKTIL